MRKKLGTEVVLYSIKPAKLGGPYYRIKPAIKPSDFQISDLPNMYCEQILIQK